MSAEREGIQHSVNGITRCHTAHEGYIATDNKSDFKIPHETPKISRAALMQALCTLLRQAICQTQETLSQLPLL
jgi:hypothetical protein